MFGALNNTPASSAGGSSPFPALNLAVPTLDASGRKRSIFDAGTSQNQPASGGLFSNTGGLFNSNASTSAPQPPATTAATSTNPFNFPTGNASTTAASSAPASNPFQNFGRSTAQTSSGTTAPNLFGGQQQQQQQPPPPLGSSVFNNQQATGQSEPTQFAEPPGRTPTSEPIYFRSLLERQKRTKFADQNVGLNPLPGLNMDLGDLARKAQEIGRRTSRHNAVDSRAHYLLAGAGVLPGKAYKDFQAMEDDVMEEQPLPREAMDSNAGRYMQDLQQKGREAMMKESMDRVHREVDAFIQDSLGIDLEEQKQRIMEHFGLVPKGDNNIADDPLRHSGTGGSFGRTARSSRGAFADSAKTSTRSVFGRSGLDKSIIGTPGLTGSTASFFGEEATGHVASSLSRGQTARDLRDKERLYIEKVEQMNRTRLQNRVFPVMQQFAQVEEAAGGDSPRQLLDAYQALSEITKENPRVSSPMDATAVKERQYAASYLNENTHPQRSIRLKKLILDGSRTYLEKTFFQKLENVVERNPREAQLGGRPNVTNKVRAYIRVRSAQRDLAPDGAELQQVGEDGDYCWMLIFYLLRSGYAKEALDYVENEPAFQSTDKRFGSYLKNYYNSPDRRLTRKLQEMINGEYSQRQKIATQHSIDPYRMACYKIVGRCDLSSRNLDVIGQGVEDWTWLQFSLAREQDRSEETPGEGFGLEQICETVAEIGQKHFQKGQADSSGGYGTFFFMQILAGMFEEAVAYLHSNNPVSTVHFAIALSYYGLLRVSDYTVAGNELLTYSTSQQPQINFVPLIAHYTAAFRTALPVSAVDYLSLICLNSDLTPPNLGAAQTAACHECLRQLCLETREFARLLGDIRTDGTRLVGAIEEKAELINLKTHQEFLIAVTTQAAAIANERGQIADAVLLYHLSEDYDNVVGILNRALADAVTLDLGESPMQLQPLKPRRRQDQNSPNGSGSTASDSPQSSLSLTQSTSSPVELARNMISLYNENAAYYNAISEMNRNTCGALLQLLSARANLESNPPQYMAALETLNDLNILPLQANGSIPAIRAAASAFGTLPQVLARCAGVSVVWAVRAIGGERDSMMKQGSWEAGQGSDRDTMKEQLNSMAKDLMVFAGLVKYKLPGRVYDLLTRAGGDVGVY